MATSGCPEFDSQVRRGVRGRSAYPHLEVSHSRAPLALHRPKAILLSSHALYSRAQKHQRFALSARTCTVRQLEQQRTQARPVNPNDTMCRGLLWQLSNAGAVHPVRLELGNQSAGTGLKRSLRQAWGGRGSLEPLLCQTGAASAPSGKHRAVLSLGWAG